MSPAFPVKQYDSFAEWLEENADDDLGDVAAPDTTPIEAGDASEPQFIESCHKCDGSGKFRNASGRVTGTCLKCRGRGSRKFKTSPETRAKRGVQRYDARLRDAVEAFGLAERAAAITADQTEAIHLALHVVAEGANFTQADAWMGGALSAREKLSPHEAALGAHIARKYRR